jgi:hypothetical protein
VKSPALGRALNSAFAATLFLLAARLVVGGLRSALILLLLGAGCGELGVAGFWVSLLIAFDYQFINNPYNRNRGPVSVLGTRLHMQF